MFLCLQAPQSDPPSWTPRGYSSNSCFEVLYNGSKREALLYPLEGKLEGGVLLDVCSCKASAPKASSAADGGGGGRLMSLSFLLALPLPRGNTRLGVDATTLWGFGARWRGGCSQKGRGASTQLCPSSGNSTAVGDPYSGVLFLLPG